jgi:glycosyltransferase involved in cell wall biosynthesis
VKVAFHVDQLWAPVPGGIGTYTRELLAALPAEDPSSELVPFRSRAVDPAATAGDAGGVQERPAISLTWSPRYLYPAWALAGRPRLPPPLADCDVVHATNHAAIPPASAGQALVVTVHDLAFERFPALFPASWRWLYRAGLRAALRRADRLLVPSNATADDLRDHGADPGAIRVTPLAASLPKTAADIEEVCGRLGVARPYVLVPGTVEPRKNQARVVRAYRQVAPDVPHALVLAGPDGWRAESLDAELARRGPGRVVRTGRLEEADLDALYRGADLVAYLSLYEGFGLPVIEAMRRGVPVVASTTPAVAETAGDAASLVDPEDVAAIAEAIAAVLTDPGHGAALSERGTARAAQFSWGATARATLDAYREVVTAAPHGRT